MSLRGTWEIDARHFDDGRTLVEWDNTAGFKSFNACNVLKIEMCL